MRFRWLYLYGIGWYLLGISKLIYDELLTINRFACCDYPVPFLGTFDTYVASYLPFTLIFVGVTLISIATAQLVTDWGKMKRGLQAQPETL